MSSFNDVPYVSMAEREMRRVEQSSKDYDGSDSTPRVATLQDEQNPLIRDLNTYNAVVAAPSPEDQKLIIPNQPSSGVKPLAKEVTLFSSQGYGIVKSAAAHGALAAAAQGTAFLFGDAVYGLSMASLAIGAALPPLLLVAIPMAVGGLAIHAALPLFSLGCVAFPTMMAKRVCSSKNGPYGDSFALKEGERASLGVKIAAVSVGVLASCAIAATDVMLYKNAYDTRGLSNPSVIGFPSVFGKKDAKDLRLEKVHSSFDKPVTLTQIKKNPTVEQPATMPKLEKPAPVTQQDGIYYLPEGSTIYAKESTVNVLPAYNTAHSEACFAGKVIKVSDPTVVGLESFGNKTDVTYHARAAFKVAPNVGEKYVIKYENGVMAAREMGSQAVETCRVR